MYVFPFLGSFPHLEVCIFSGDGLNIEEEDCKACFEELEEQNSYLGNMKFMKLGSKPDTFQTDENNVR